MKSRRIGVTIFTAILCCIGMFVSIMILLAGLRKGDKEIALFGSTSFYLCAMTLLSCALSIRNIMAKDTIRTKASVAKDPNSFSSDNIPFITGKDGSKRGAPLEPKKWPWEF